MGLEEEIKKEEEELAKLEETEAEGDGEEAQQTEGEDNDDDQQPGDADETDTDDDETNDAGDADGVDEEGDEAQTGKKETQTNKDAAKARIERREKLRQQREEAQQRMRDEAAGQQKPQGQDDQQQAQGDEDKEWAKNFRQQEEARQLREHASKELSQIENEFMQTVPDYKEASTHMIKSMLQGAMHFNPAMTQDQAVEAVQSKVLHIAADAARHGQNPAEVLYQMAFDRFGFDPTQQTKTPGKKTNAAENLKKSAKNRRRSANGLTGGGQNAGARVTIEEADNMDLATFGNMSESEIDELINQAAS